MMELFWTQEAIQDRDAIYEYIEADNLQEKARCLVDHPGMGRPGREAVTRELVAH